MEKTASTPIIADTSGLVSLVVTTDHNHTAATQAAKRLRSTLESSEQRMMAELPQACTKADGESATLMVRRASVSVS